MPPLRLAYLMPNLATGGAEKQAVRTLNAIAGRFEVSAGLFVLQPEHRSLPVAASGALEVHSINWSSVWQVSALPELRRALAEFSPDVVHAWLQLVFPYAALSKPPGTELIYGYRNSGVVNEVTGEPRSWRGRTAVRLFRRFADLHLFNSRNGMENWSELTGIAREDCRVLPNYLEPAEFADTDEAAIRQLREELRTEDADWTLLCAGRIELPIKGQDVLLNALPEIEAELGAGLVLFAGDGPDADSFNTLVETARKGIQSELRLLGWREDLPKLMQVADALILPSRSEGFPNVVAEAMASALPVISTRVGAVPEMLDEGEAGFLAEPDDPAALAKAVVEALSDRDKLIRIGERGREWLLEHYAPERMLTEHYELYLEIAEA